MIALFKDGFDGCQTICFSSLVGLKFQRTLRFFAAKRSADIRSDLGQASNEGPAPKSTQPWRARGRRAAGRVARSLQPAAGGCASLAPCHPPFCLYARPIPVFQQSLRPYLRTKLLQPTIHAQRYAAIRQTNGLSTVKPTAMFETKGPWVSMVFCWACQVITTASQFRAGSDCGRRGVGM
jgi:hypothetical protein